MSQASQIVHDVFTFRIEDLGWTALSIISISVVFIYSVSAAGDPRRPSMLKVRPPNYLAQSKQRKAELAAVIELEHSRTRIRQSWATKGFHLQRLPLELQLLVLSYSADWPKTYRALVLVSRHIYQSTLRACLPLISITLTSTKQITAFASLVHKDQSSLHIVPFAVGPLVHRLWVSALRREDFMDAYHVLRACTNVRVLACDARGLAMITKSPRFKHTMCKDLTLLLTRPSWGVLMNAPSGLQLLRQLTHLRVTGEQNVPREVALDNLLHLSYSERSTMEGQDISNVEKPSALSNLEVFPSLRQVVLTRRCGPEEQAPLKVNEKLVLLQVRRDLTEMGIWRDGLNGESLWQQAARALPAPKKPFPKTS